MSRSHICEIDQNPGLTGIGICSVCYQQNWESWKGFEIIILMVWWHFMKKYALLCVYSDICHRHFMPHRAMNYIIERFGVSPFQQSIFFHELSLDHQTNNFVAFSRLSMLLIADKTNTNSCQAWILVNFTNVTPAHSSIQYRQTYIATHMYEKFLKICWNIYMGGLLKSVNFFLYAL